MSYFLSPKTLTEGEVLTISGSEARHILQSRRMKAGETFHLQDSAGARHLVMLAEMKGKGALMVQVGPAVKMPEEPSLKISLYQALVAEQALDFVIQKATELGVTRMVIFHSERSPFSLPKSKLAKKLERWNAIALEAAKQSDRLQGAEISWEPSLKDALLNIAPKMERLALSQHGKDSLNSVSKKIKPENGVSVFIGPEGGWSEEEQDLFTEDKLRLANLGPRILRAETASLTAVTILQATLGDMQ